MAMSVLCPHSPAVLPDVTVGIEARIQPGDPATSVMTDFSRERPVTVTPDRAIDAALADMVHSGVRALVVLAHGEVVGLITSYDIQGEKPMQFLHAQTAGAFRHEDIKVRDIMIGWSDLPAIAWRTAQSARVDQVSDLFRATGASHIVVVDTQEETRHVLRGLLSRSRLERQLMMPAAA